MKPKKLLSVLLVLVMLCTLLPAALAAVDMTEVDTWEDFKTAVEAGESVRLTADITGKEGMLIPKGVSIELDLNGHSLQCASYTADIDGDANNCAFAVRGGLTLKDGTGQGILTVADGDTVPDIGVIVDGGSFTMNGGALVGFDSVDIWLVGGKADIEDGWIIPGMGDGILPQGPEDFYNGGYALCISDGTASISGGNIITSGTENGTVGCNIGLYIYGGSCTMSGGTISGMKAHCLEGANYSWGGHGVAVDGSGSFTMNGGRVTSNDADGIKVCDQGKAYVYGEASITYNQYYGLDIEGTDAYVGISGAPDISFNEIPDIGLSDGAVFHVDGPLTNEKPYTITCYEEQYDQPVSSGLSGNGDAAHFASAYPDQELGTNAEGELTVTYMETEYIENWEELKAALAEGKRCCLIDDIKAPAGAGELEVPAGASALLDLYGCNIDCGDAKLESGIIVHGDLTLRNTYVSDGELTGADYGVQVDGGKFTMTGGAVRNCGKIGVYVTGEGSTATVSGGEISGAVGYYEDNWFYHGTGLQAEYGAAAEIKGGVISGNVFGAKAIEATITFSGGEVRDNHEVPLGEDDTYGGGGLYTYHGKIKMTGGTISGNSFAGLYTDEGSEAEVSGGTISGNSFAGLLTIADSKTTVSGGTISGDGSFAIQMRSGSVTVTGGEITGGAEAAIHLLDGALHIDGGTVSGSPKDAVWVTGGEVTMTDGVLSDNAWNGVHLDAGSFVMSGGEIRGSGYNGVVLNGEDASCVMTGGTISGSQGEMLLEESWYEGGDGVMVLAGSFEMRGGELFDNVDGIEVLRGSAAMSGGVIRDCHIGYSTGEIYYGGSGVGVFRGDFTMTGGTIRDNEDRGILSWYLGSTAVSGGEISNCFMGIMQDGGELCLSGAPKFRGMDFCDVGLTDGTVIALNGPLTVITPISVDLEDYPDAGESRILTSGLQGNGSIYQFTTIRGDAYHVEEDENGEAVMVCGPDPYSDDDDDPTPSGGTKPEDKTAQTEEESVTYTNVPEDAWYASDAAFAQEVNLFGESGEQPFDGEEEVDRGTAVFALWVLAGKPGEGEDAAVAWAKETGILKGDGSGDYALGEDVTREQLCTMIYRYLQENGKGFTGMWAFRLDFNDADRISDYAYEAVSYLVMEGILKGMDGELNPGGIATKAQVAALMQRVEEFLT